ncbi:MAG: DUF262 domain-containing HNH endonuclease family protein [Candidatus Omnitrophica bacterium]|nr:DUF262 domain-containing HNH endonuclease family protein [Candidatus Omnitrophota bacterium]
MPTIEFKQETVGHFIADNFLKVPIYQRSFAWEKTNVRELLDDIKNSYPDDYFIGTIVVTNKGDYYEIVDGQQRLATMYIFFVAVRDLLRHRSHDKWKYIEAEYLFKEALRDEEKQQKLRLNASDNEFLLNRLLNSIEDFEISKESHKRILEAYREVSSFVESEYKSKGLNALFDLIDFINKKLKIIVVIVPDEVNAFTIFETLNDRGLALSQTDLMKNYLFDKASDRLVEAQEKWASFTGAIESTIDEEEILQYIRYFWSSKHGLVREKELFKEIKSKITNKNAAITFLHNLEKGSELYLALLNPTHSLWKEYPNDCKNSIFELNELKLIQPRPLLLAILEMFENKDDVAKALKLIVSWSVRNLITGVIGAGTLEREFSNQAKLINEGKIKTFNQFKRSILPFIPTDEQFKSAFKIATVSKSYIARYYLRKLEEIYRKTKELSPLTAPEEVNLEHILPENPRNLKADWPHFDEITHKTYVKRIGNLTLISSKLNERIANGDFKSKKRFYKNSEIEITKRICEYKKWTPEIIEERQEDFANKAVEVWKI